MLTSTSLSQVLTLSPFNSARVEGGWYRVTLYKMPTGNPPPILIRRMSSTQGKKQNKTMKKKKHGSFNHALGKHTQIIYHARL